MIVKEFVIPWKQRLRHLNQYTYVTHFVRLLFLTLPVCAGSTQLPVGARSLAMGSTYVAVANTADAVFLNPAGLGRMGGFELSLFYQKPFGLRELNFGTVALTASILNQRLGFGISTFGNQIYRENSLVLAYSNAHTTRFFYGLSLRIQSVEIDGYGSSTSVGFDLGMLVPLRDDLMWGFFTRNLNRPSLGASSERLPLTFDSGFSMRLGSQAAISAEIFKDVRYPEEVRLGLEYYPMKPLALRAGVANHPARFSAGFGVKVRRFVVDYAFFTHNDLGLTHQISFSVQWGAKKKPKEPVVAGVPRAKNAAAEIEPPEQRSKINLNTATLEELSELKGLGRKLAERILAFRREHGAFEHLEDLLKIPGIGARTLDKLRRQVYIDKLAAGETGEARKK